MRIVSVVAERAHNKEKGSACSKHSSAYARNVKCNAAACGSAFEHRDMRRQFKPAHNLKPCITPYHAWSPTILGPSHMYI